MRQSPKEIRNIEIVRRLRNPGETYKSIGLDFGISRERVRQIRVKYGLPARRIQRKRYD